ncbi:hypothetical protein DAC20_160 [Bacteroides phage DAC20]|jgi:hypothetical protein|nr:hypothetical protein DAC19_161 [Bacteroides phage DAC19]QIG63910.1 hypothetical protein DAC20_160 [Bacteroides phage DAC20]QIG64174.1 hypothetical protein DAC22_163 [Bacteroides phage DAC22]QIG64430.1 hypothetical protein DAC23_155 [Bacteroides phage DAC23]
MKEEELVSTLANLNEEPYIYDIDYVQAPTLKELLKKVRAKMESKDNWTPIEQNPFLDTTQETPMWTQVMIIEAYDDEEEEE